MADYLYLWSSTSQWRRRTPPMVKEIFSRAIMKTHDIEEETIPVWNGQIVCRPDVDGRIVWSEGMVAVNAWSNPDYRKHIEQEGDLGLAGEFMEALFPRADEREIILNWLTWNLRNEADKPAWAPFLFSKTKGSGKSTFCALVRRLFGERNSATQNNVDKLTGQFNSTVLLSKLVVCEELQLQTRSTKGNALKTYITEKSTLVERKGIDAQTMTQCCCFLFTTNHLPTWIEKGERRYYLVDIDHDGHASGPRAKEFSELVGRLHEFMAEDQNMAGVYRALKDRELPADFSAKSLNTEEVATELMVRLAGISDDTIPARLEEELRAKGRHAITEKDLSELITKDLGTKLSATRHLMGDLGWSRAEVKWGGNAFAKVIWVEPQYSVGGGKIYGPDSYQQNLAEHLEAPCPLNGVIAAAAAPATVGDLY